MGEVRENLKRNLGYFLMLRGISQKELAEQLHVSQAAVTNWIKGKNAPDIETVAKICEILNITVVDLFGITGEDAYTEQERELIRQYRNKPSLQEAVRILLGLEHDQN